MTTIDAQIHIWDEDRPERPWDREYARTRAAFLEHGGEPPTLERALAALDRVGVDGALVTSFLLYPDIFYSAEAAARHPDRFGVVAQVDLDHDRPAQLVDEFVAQSDLVALRLSFHGAGARRRYERLADGEFEPVFAAAARHQLPVMLLVSGDVPRAAPVLERHPETTFVIDHLGVVQGPHRDVPVEPFAQLEQLLALSEHANVTVKLTGAPTLSREDFPYRDIWPHVRRVVDAFGSERVMWGSDFTRTRTMHSYAEAIGWVRDTDLLTPAEREDVLGRALKRLLRWPRHRDR